MTLFDGQALTSLSFWANSVSMGAASTSVQGASATAGKIHVVTNTTVGTDLGFQYTIESPNGTIKWRGFCPAAQNIAERFEPGVIQGAVGSEILIRNVTAPTASATIGIAGFTIPG